MGHSICTLGGPRGRMVGLRPALVAAALLGAALALASCASPAVRECGATGVLCPEGTHCAAAEGICIPDTNTCGDAHLDPGEVCDDGNTKDGDGCSHDCKSDESCGNGITDLTARIPEVCDDGNTADGDKCSHDCLSKETCGNGITDINEECDDGNQEKGDLCSPQCRKEVCGNGILDPGEACDLLPVDTARCSEDCKSSRMCGNGIVDPGEECDLGTNNNKDNGDCRSDCVINRCGDGFRNTEGSDGHLEHLEACDDAPPADKFSRDVRSPESPSCNADCSAPSCGDGIINRQYAPTTGGPTEQCDNGKNAGGTSLNQDNADCTAGCQVNVCGDNHYNTVGPLHVEGCDDGNRNDLDTCSNGCIAATCGDGIVGNGEECDLGPGNANNDNGACLASCKLAKCGDGKVRTGVEECDGGANCSATCKIQKCGNGIIDPNEECDLGAANNNSGDCRTDCILNRCGDGYVNSLGAQKEACDGAAPVGAGSHTVTPTETADCNINCTTPACGDKIVNLHFTPKTTGGQPGPGTEQCDDGLRVDGDGCSQNCRFERCGNGVVDAGEQCDGTANCSSSCFRQECNNGILDPGEECDLGAANSDTGACLKTCKLARCGDGKIRTGVEECDGGANCSATCKKQECGNGIIDPNEECDNGAANDDHGDCRADCILNRCGDGHTNTLGSHPEACDGATAQPAGSHTVTPTDTATCNKDCTMASCGDGRINKAVKPDGTNPEQCDPPSAGNGCSATCQFENCGNKIVDPGEECDDGNTTEGDACDSNCTKPVCGNGIKDPGEACDDGNGVDFDGCDHNCTLSSTCGNGVVDTGELCDDGNLTCGSCSAACDAITLAPAQGVILTAGEAAFTNPTGNTLVIGDGATTKTFELTKTTASGTNIPVVLAAGDSATDVAVKLTTAIAGSGLQLDATRVVDAIVLQNKRSSTKGNVNVVQSFTVSGFTSYGMTGGAGGDCAKDQKCVQASDCASNSCLGGKCT